ncbi:MAG: tetratricopeptide repeat protein [Chthoniobacterales bacterium]
MSRSKGSRHGTKKTAAPRFVWNEEWIFAAVLVLATALAYQQVWHAGYIWDDDSHLTQNPCIVGPLGFRGIWTTAAATYYPLVLTSFWVQHALWGLNPLPYHLVNVAMHAACGILLWKVLLSLRVPGAWIGAALWALHPVEVESAAWITELKNTQSCFFYLLAILFFLRWRSGAAREERHAGKWNYGLALLCALLAILSKSSTVMLPVVLGLCWWWMDGRWRWRNVVALVPFLVVSFLAALWTIWEQKFHSNAIGPSWTQTWPERLIVAGCDIWFYLGKLAWPYPLAFLYPRWKIDTSQVFAYLPTLSAVGGMLALWWYRNGRLRPVFFAAAYFVVSLFPVLDFFDVFFFKYSFVADHFQYLASMGPLVLVAVWLRRLPRFVPATLLALLAVLTCKQVAIYQNAETSWGDTVAKNPNSWMAQNSYAVALTSRNRPEEAIAHFQKALEIDPNYVFAYSNLGHALLLVGRVEESAAYLEKALEIDPNDAGTRSNLANTLLQMGRIDEAIAELRRVLALKPDDAEAQKNMAWVLATSPDDRIRDGIKAVELAERANKLTLNRDPIVGTTLAAAYAETGRFADAIRTAEAALKGAEDSGNVVLANAIRAQILLYRSDQPSRDVR